MPERPSAQIRLAERFRDSIANLRAWFLSRWSEPTPAPPPNASPAEPPPPFATLEGAASEPAELDAVIAREIQYVRFHRHPDRSFDEVKQSLVGLALSGGGIRSATTNLGILQALSSMNILPMVDVMCTVSGGGYIGTCLSTLLSLNEKRLPKTPNAMPARGESDPHQFRPGDRPAFDTTAERFPFRIGQTTPELRRATDVVAHLRTHGNFLIAHRGLLRRDTMRAVGNLVTGVAYNVLGFLLLLVAVSALYLGVARKLVPGLTEPRAGAVPAFAPFDTARPTLVVGDTTRERILTVPCATGVGMCEERVRVPLGPPEGITWLRYHASRATTELVSAWNRLWSGQLRPLSLSHPALLAFHAGLLLSLLAYAFVWTALKGYYRHWSLITREPNAGESQGDAFDRGVLRFLSLIAFAALIGVLVYSRTKWGSLDPAAQFVWLSVPLIMLVGARVGSFILAIFLPLFLGSAWTRRFRSLWGGYQAVTIYGMWITLTFAALVPLMFAFADARGRLAVGGVASLLMARLLAKTGAGSRGRLGIPAAVVRPLLAVAVLAAVGFGVVFFGAELARRQPSTAGMFWIFAGAAATVFVLSLVVDQNKLSPHYFYRDRIAETYLLSEIPDTRRRLWVFRDAIEMPLYRLHGELVKERTGSAEVAPQWRNPAPYHLISAAINLAGSKDLTRKDRKSGYWLFSKLFCGSVHTGFRPTERYRRGETKVARATAISGAAASSAMGFMTFFAQAFSMVLFNIRLGCWMENPARPSASRYLQEGLVSWLWFLMKEVTMTTTETDRLVNLSDGGHTGDNIGIYPLLQRGCKVIIACDAEQDGALAFGSLTEALRHAYIDMGVQIDIDLSMIRPDPVTGRSRSHCAVGRIRYPDRPSQPSYLIYMKNSLTGDEQEPVLNYKVSHPSFPHESTIDQFFTDAQFESYRALGVHIAETTFEGWIASDLFTSVFEYHRPTPSAA
jgi:hypothetical protein